MLSATLNSWQNVVKRGEVPENLRMNKVILIIFLLGFGVLLFGYYILVFEPNNIQIEKQVIVLKNLPSPFDGIKIAQLSDFHSRRFGDREKRVLRILKEIEPDFVFITGDFVDPLIKATTDWDFSSVRIFWQELAQQYNNQVFAVLGNHDGSAVEKYLKKSGIPILDNENKKLFVGDEFIYLIGVDDPATGRDDLSKALGGVGENRPKILLAHSPDIIGQAAEQKIDLVLAGHTHGGQVNIPFVEPFWIPSKYGGKYASGLFKVDSTYLYVNRGIGTFFLPIRFNSPPEITLIKLTFQK